MERQLEDLLIQKFPEYLGNLQFHGCYIDCQKGWFVPIFQFLQEMKLNGFVFEIGAIKEKFGSLRLYPALRHYPFNDEPDSKVLDDKVWDAIDRLQARSAEVCEFCGDTGRIRWDWIWIRTLCDKCESTYDQHTSKRDIPWDECKFMRGRMILPEEIRKTMAPRQL